MMDRSREARRAAGMVASSNGLSRRRHRSSSLRDSPDEDGAVELQESVRLRERVKKDRDRDRDRERDRERDRDRDRERERERERERSSRSSKRRRGERMMLHGSSTREDGGGDDSSEEESVNDDEEDEDEDNNNNNNQNNNNNGHHNSGGVGGGGGVRLLPPNPNSGPAVGSISNHYHGGNSNNNHHPHSNSTNHNHNHQHQHLQNRKSFPPSTGTGTAKVYRAAPVWKSGEETIGVPVPRKARSASIKRSHDWMANNTGGNGGVGVGGGGGEQIHRQASTSPVRQNIVSTSTPSSAAPMSPSSSNASARKKIKPNGQKQPRPPKSSSKASSSNPEELEIEIAEVLYGLKTQSQAPPKKEFLFNDSGEVNRSSSDTKSRVSSPISNSPSTNIQSSAAIQPPNSCSSAGPLSAIAPKRKRPRQVSENPGGYSVRSSPISSTASKMEIDQTPKAENTSPNMEKAPGSESEYGYDLGNMVNTQGLPTELMKADSELKPASAEGHGESRDVIPKEELAGSPKKESSAVKAEESNRDDAVTVTVTASALASSSSVTKVSSAVPVVNSQMEKFQIDLEAPPPQSRSSPERETEINSMNSEMDNKPVVAEEMKPASAQDKDDGKLSKMGSEAAVITGCEEKRAKLTIEEPESQNKVRNIDLQFDLEKPERDSGMSNKHPQQQAHKQHQLPSSSKAAKDEQHGEKIGHSSSLPLPMSMASWPGGLPPMGYMAPIQGVVSMDGTTVSPAPIQSFFSQPRPKRCATHCYIARNIHYLQQFIKMNPFWPAAAAAAGSASLFGSKPLSVVPPPDLHSNLAGRAANNAQDKAQGLAIFPGHGVKDKSSQPTNSSDASQRKQQILLQQALPPVAPNNILHGPAFIFPLSQQPAASARPGSVKQPTNSGNLASTSASNSAAASSSATAAGAAAVSFNYPNMPGNETPYLAILQNNPYHFPIPAAVGGPPPNYRGTHPQPLPMFNGSFYSSQIIHPSQLQQQPQSASQSQQMQQNHQNNSMSSGSSSSQKHLQSHQQRPGSAIGGGNGSGSGNMHNFPPPKNRQQSQQPQNQQMTQSQARQLENDVGAEDSPSTADSRGARGPVNIYGQNFAMPIHPQNYALLTTPAALANANATNSSNNHQSEKKQQQSQQQGKNGVESLPPHTFAMSFASMNGATAPGIDLSSMAQNHAILQSLPEATRHNIQMMAATAAAAHAAQRKSFRISEDGKNGAVDSSNMEDDRKSLSGKPQVSSGQSIAFSRSELGDVSGSATAVNNVIDSSARSLNLASGPSWTARSTIPSNLGVASLSNAQLQHQHQPQQMMQLQKQQQLAASSAGRSKTPSTSNGSMYPEHLSSASSIAAKFPNSLSAFPQNFVQTGNNNSPTQSPQWKNSGRPNTSQSPSSFVTSTASTLKSLPQQQGRSQQSHTQISFGSNPKTSANPQGQQAASSIQSPSSPMMVGSPSNSSISKGASGSPRTTSASANSKTGQASSLSTQQVKSSSVPGQKSSPVGGRNVPSILGNPHITSSTGQKPQMQSQQQQQLPKNMQQGQLFFSNPYMQTQSSHSTNTNAAAAAASAGYYIQRRRPDQQQQPQGSSAASTGMLTLSPVSLAGAVTSDPAKAIAAATVAASNMKGGLPPQSILHTAQFATQSTGNQHQLLPAGFPYVHPVPAAVQVKPAEQKQPAGNDNLHACWQPEKK